jgi:hypothetical protein
LCCAQRRRRQGDGTLTIIKETSPTTFEVEQTVQTKSRAKTCTLDTKHNHIIVITIEPTATTAPATATTPAAGAQTAAATPPSGGDQPGGGKKGGRKGGGGGPGLLDIIVVGK